MHHDQVGSISGMQHSKINVIHHIKMLKKKQNYMIISIDTERTFEKIQHILISKTVNKLQKEKNFLNLIKDIYKKNLQNTL